MRKKVLVFFLVFVVLCLSLNAAEDTLTVKLEVESIPDSVKFTTDKYTNPAEVIPDDFLENDENKKIITLSADTNEQKIYVSARTNSSEAFSRKLIYTDLYRYIGETKQDDYIVLSVKMDKGKVTYPDASNGVLDAPRLLSDGSKGYEIQESAEKRGLRAIYYPLTISVDKNVFTEYTAGEYKAEITIETSGI